ncbi:MAG: OsmC family protein [Candidatus Omnitrophica bacterium]|nr:OsmC family protein [Candidatus Omnitrophota bacterium]
MDVNVHVEYKEKHIFAVHTENSQSSFYIDKKEEGYTPLGANSLELLLSSLAGCIGVYANSYLTRHDIGFTYLKTTAHAQLAQSSPQRLTDITVQVHTDADIGDKKDVFMRFIHNCPVHNTLLHTEGVNIELK